MRDVVLDIRAGQAIAAAHKAGKHPGRHRQHAAAGQPVFRYFQRQTHTACAPVQRNIAFQPPGQPRDIMVGQVRANPGKRVARADTVPGNLVRIPNARQLEDLGRLDGPGAEDHLAVSLDGDVAPGLPTMDACYTLICCRRIPCKGKSGDMRAGQHAQIRPPSGRVQIGFLGRETKPVLLRHLIMAKPVLTGTVIVAVMGVTAGLRRLDQQVECRISGAQGSNVQRPAAGAEFICVIGEFAMFGAPKKRQQVGKAPPRIAALRPAIIIGGLATDIKHGVDRRGAAKNLAAWLFDPAPVTSGFRFGLEHPIDCRIDHRLDIAGRDMDQRVPVLAACFQQHDR